MDINAKRGFLERILGEYQEGYMGKGSLRVLLSLAYEQGIKDFRLHEKVEQKIREQEEKHGPQFI